MQQVQYINSLWLLRYLYFIYYENMLYKFACKFMKSRVHMLNFRVFIKYFVCATFLALVVMLSIPSISYGMINPKEEEDTFAQISTKAALPTKKLWEC